MTDQFSSIQEQGRKQRARYKSFYLLTRILLLAGPRFAEIPTDAGFD